MNEYLLAPVIALAVTALIMTVVRVIHRQQKAAVEQLQRLGFFETPGPDPALLAALRDLVPTRRQQLQVGTIYRRTAGYADMYAFYPDMNTSSSSSLAVRVPQLDLPVFRLFGKIKVGGLLGGLVNNLVEQTIGKDLKPSTWASDPALGEHYFLFAEDPARVERFLIENWGSLLRERKNHLSVFGKGNLLAFSRSVVAGRTPKHMLSAAGEDPFAAFVQTVDVYVRSIRSDRRDRMKRADQTVA